MRKININRFLLLTLTAFIFSANSAFAYPWINDLKTLFISNKAVIYTINIRSFGAVDKNNNDIIEPWLGDTPGTFINAQKRLDEIVELGANTIYLLPVTKVGKLKALGTSGSLYAMDSFNELNPQLDDKNDSKSVFAEAKSFIQAAHKKKLRVIIDMPSCGSYDMSLEKPDLFIKDKHGNTVYPADWTDVRLFKTVNSDGSLNKELLSNYKKFADMALALGADGIRADVAAIKPYEFWKEFISYVRKSDPQFLFIAEASTSWDNPAKDYVTYTSVEDLLKAGFDGYYGDWGNFGKITKAKDFHKLVAADKKITDKLDGQKTTMATFATHDQQSPMLIGGENYWDMVLWLTATLPLNSYFLDGFPTGDTYIYKYENQKAAKTFTDDDQYFVHRGKIDIFNAAKRPDGGKKELKTKYLTALKFKYWAKNLLIDGKYVPLNTGNQSVFAYARTNGADAVVVIGNLDNKNNIETSIYIPKLKATSFVSPMKMGEPPETKNGRLLVKLQPGEIQVFMLSKVPVK